MFENGFSLEYYLININFILPLIYQGIVVHNATGLAGLKTTLQNPETGEYIVEDATHDNGKEMGPLADDEIPKVNNSEATLKDPDNAGDNDTTTDNAEKKTSEGDDDEEEEPIDMKFPTGENANWKKILIYLVSFPLMAPMYITLPDTRDKSSKSRSFTRCLRWIRDIFKKRLVEKKDWHKNVFFKKKATSL